MTLTVFSIIESIVEKDTSMSVTAVSELCCCRYYLLLRRWPILEELLPNS